MSTPTNTLCGVGLDPRLDLVPFAISGSFEIVSGLHANPELGRGTEKSRQAQRSVRCDRPFSIDDCADPDLWNADRLGKGILAKAQRLQKILAQHVSWMGRRKVGHDGLLSDSQQFRHRR